MGMRDESWCCSCGGHIPFTEDENAQCGPCATDEGIEAIESIIRLIENKYNECEQALSDINDKYADGSFFDKQDSSMVDYYEGAVETLGVVLHKAKEIYNG